MHSGPSRALQIAGRNLQLDTATIEVASSLRSHDVRFLLLKGPTIARWLYEDASEREYTDCDLLIDPERFEQASLDLASLGFDCLPTEDRPSGVPFHTQNWIRSKDGAIVELHHYLVGVRTDPQSAFDKLFQGSTNVALRGHSVPALGLPGRALHLALHAAQHGRGFPKALEDLERGVTQLPISLWSEATDLAYRIKATDALVGGLGLVTRGPSLIADLKLPRHSSREVALLALSAGTFSMGLEWLSQARGWRAKARYILRMLLPTPDYIRSQTGRLEAKGAQLGYLYLLRWTSQVRRAPRGFAQWIEAWRRSRKGKPPT